MAKILWLIWDGASHALVVDLLRRGALPHLQRVVTRGSLTAMAPPGRLTAFSIPGADGSVSADSLRTFEQLQAGHGFGQESPSVSNGGPTGTPDVLDGNADRFAEGARRRHGRDAHLKTRRSSPTSRSRYFTQCSQEQP